MTPHQARMQLARVIPEREIIRHIGLLGSAHVFAVAPSRRAVVDSTSVLLTSPTGEPLRTLVPK
jgi:hypothetical protein